MAAREWQWINIREFGALGSSAILCWREIRPPLPPPLACCCRLRLRRRLGLGDGWYAATRRLKWKVIRASSPVIPLIGKSSLFADTWCFFTEFQSRGVSILQPRSYLADASRIKKCLYISFTRKIDGRGLKPQRHDGQCKSLRTALFNIFPNIFISLTVLSFPLTLHNTDVIQYNIYNIAVYC